VTKVTDDQVLVLKSKVDNGNVTVTDGCKKLGIAPVTFYRRLEKLTKKSDEMQQIVNNVTNELPITIQTIQAELGSIISNLKEMKPKDMRESLSVIDRQINALDKLNNTLKTTQILIDNRTTNVTISSDAIAEAVIRDVVVPALRSAGIQASVIEKVGDKMQELYEKEKGKWST